VVSNNCCIGIDGDIGTLLGTDKVRKAIVTYPVHTARKFL